MTSSFRVRDWADDMPPIRTMKGHVDHLAHRVLHHLARRANGTSGIGAWPTIQAMSVRFGVERRDVRRALETLEKLGLIADHGESEHGSTVWHLQVEDPAPLQHLRMLEKERSAALSRANAARQARHRSRKSNSEGGVSNAASAVTRNSEDSVTSNSEGGVMSQRGGRYVTARGPLRNAASAPLIDNFNQTSAEQTHVEQTPAPNPDPEEDQPMLLDFNDLDLASSMQTPDPPKKRKRSAQPTDDPDFDRAWELYDHRSSKADARKAWRRAVKKVSPDTILAAIPGYVAATKKPGQPDRGVFKPNRKNFATWLNAECWTDEIEEPKSGYQGNAGSDALAPEEYIDRTKSRPIRVLIKGGTVPTDEYAKAWYYHWNRHEQAGWTLEQLLETGNTEDDARWLLDAYRDGIDQDLYRRFLDYFSITDEQDVR
jgi:hypothetical protein